VRIAIAASWFATQAGYAENCLSKTFAALGHEVHVVTSVAQPYFETPFYKEVYEPWLGPPLLEPGLTSHDGYRIHRLEMTANGGDVRIDGLRSELRRIRPDIVQTFEVQGRVARATALGRLRGGSRLFTGAHLHASVFPDAAERRGLGARFSPEALGGRLVGVMSERCYAISPDAAEIAVEFLGIPADKVVVSPLGVDTDVFRPLGDPGTLEARRELRSELGFSDQDVVCVYTGRLTAGEYGKNPLALAQAVARLADAGHRIRGLFVGGGDSAYETEIASHAGCVLHPFVGYKELARFYWASDIGVWPRQESTSQIDAAATGLPLILSDKTRVTERVDGIGLLYREDDVDDLANQILKLADPELRGRLGGAAAQRMQKEYSWRHLAEKRLADYERALAGR
jgi:glycosyltransferase involved in cell wall biosynthesis